MPYIPYTDEQKQLANSVDLPTFLRMRGEKLVHVGREFKLVYHDGYGKHDSITISGSQWYDHKNQIGGGPIKFMQEHYGMNFQEAMQHKPLVTGYGKPCSSGCLTLSTEELQTCFSSSTTALRISSHSHGYSRLFRCFTIFRGCYSCVD